MTSGMRRTLLAERLKGIPLLACLEETELEELATKLRRRRAVARQPLFLQGDHGEELYLILKGSVRIVAEAPGGRELTLAVLEEGNFFGEMALLDGHPRSASAVAASDCELVMLVRSDFFEVLDRSPDSTRRLLAFLSERLRLSNQRLQDVSMQTVKQRLAAVLRDLALREGTLDRQGILLPKEVSHRTLAEMLSNSRETVSRELAELRNRGLVAQEGRRIRVLDTQGLEELLDAEEER